MSGAAPLDLRLPVGGLLAAVGVLLAAYGYATRNDRLLYAPSGGMNINLTWGAVMLASGLAFLAAARWGRRARGKSAPASRTEETSTPDGDSGAPQP